eukprot:EG_transcript_6191
MSVAVSNEPCLAIVAPENVDAFHCVTGTVVVDRHVKDIEVLHSQLRCMTVLKTADRKLRIASHIADGTWASVYCVYEADSQQSSALKVIPIEGAHVESAYAAIELLKTLRHPNIVQYHNHFTLTINDVSCLCIQLDFCGKGTLVDYIRAKANQKTGLSAAQVRDFITQLASALAYIHDQGFLHGDLRPESVLVTREREQLKLTGFGSSLRIERRGLAPRTIVGGCKSYAPPEWMDSEVPHRKLRSWETPLPSYDMWSLGCVLSELVTLKLLRNDRHYLRTALAADPEGLQAIDREVAAAHSGVFSNLLRRLLDTDPDSRITAAEALDVLQALQPQKPSSLLASFCRPFSVLASPRR